MIKLEKQKTKLPICLEDKPQVLPGLTKLAKVIQVAEQYELCTELAVINQTVRQHRLFGPAGPVALPEPTKVAYIY